jgi:hypothetical protein
MFEPLTVAPRKKVRGFSLSADTSALVDEMAAKHGVSASRVVDVALNKYLKHLGTITPEGEGEQDNG